MSKTVKFVHWHRVRNATVPGSARSTNRSRPAGKGKPWRADREFRLIELVSDILMFLVVHTGQMEAVCLGKNDADHYIEALRGFRRRHRLQSIYLVQDGGPSHIAAKTNGFFAEAQGWWQPRPTPAHASWLDRTKLVIRAFNPRYQRW